ncbi:hypothetical protein NT6N_23870 [Oceaniferula spumae]|uniref:Uncharacterized protein n=1 Tax=Oceaniferula spumae TaxID=2979115 RepID=A0AAT9FN08_9BACT
MNLTPISSIRITSQSRRKEHHWKNHRYQTQGMECAFHIIIAERRAQPRRVKQFRIIHDFSSTTSSDNERYRVG